MTKTRIFHPIINTKGFCPSVANREYIRDGHKLVSRCKKATIFIDYPISGIASFRRTSKNGWTRQKLVNTICSIYQNNIYKHPDKYGVWGHGIGDLVIERVVVANSIVKRTIIVGMSIGS